MDVTISAGFSGRPYDLRMRVYTIENNSGGNYSRYHGHRYAYSRSGYGSWINDCRTVDAWVAGQYFGGCYSLPFAPGDYAGKTVYLGEFDTGAIGHDGNGYMSMPIRVRMAPGNPFGTADTGDVWVNGDRVPRVPYKPARPVFQAATPTTIDYLFYNAPDNGGSGETGFNHQSATDVNFTVNVRNWNDSNSPGQADSLTPGTTHYIRYRSVNALGAGPWSDPLAQTTLPAVAPGLIVAPSASGTQARVTMTAPGGVTGVSHYWIDWRLVGTTAFTSQQGGAAQTVTGLTPGARYEWKASAVIGGYESPKTALQTVTQPLPSTGPGQYFDGASADTPDLDYVWTGTAHTSKSTATGQIPTGWAVSTSSSGGTAVVHQITGGVIGSHAARVTVVTDATAANMRMGQAATPGNTADVVPDAVYVGSLYAALTRANRVAAELTWLDASHSVLSRSVGPAVVVDANTWTRLEVTAASPAGAEFAAVVLVDPTGTSHVNWQGGDYIHLDAAMITLGEPYPYFDGDSADSTEFNFQWEATAHASASSRTPVAVAELVGGGSLIDPDCPPVPPPPRPPVIPTTCITETGTWRRYYGSVISSAVPDWYAAVPTFEIITRSTPIEQVRLRIYANPDELTPTEVDKSVWLSEQIISYVPADTKLTLDGVTQRAWAEVDGGAAQAAGHLLYGTGGSPATWPILSCGIAYLISIDVPIEVPVADTAVNAYLTTRL